MAEYTNATHTGLVSVAARTWCAEVFEPVGLDLAAAPELVPPGTDVGSLAWTVGCAARLPRDAVDRPGVPRHGIGDRGHSRPAEECAYISSGTWSLVGALLDRPCNTELAFEKDFTNQGAVAGQMLSTRT